MASIHCGRVKLNPDDIKFIYNLRKYDSELSEINYLNNNA
jgi:hypothetical protein